MGLHRGYWALGYMELGFRAQCVLFGVGLGISDIA